MEIDITEPGDTVAEALGTIVADLGRWLCELEERIERLERAAGAAAPKMTSGADAPFLRAV